jgi:hypothetical protein
MRELKLTEKQKERFWKRVDIQGKNDCWNWLGPKGQRGYGIFVITKNKKRSYFVPHRIAYTLVKGKPKHLCCHICDNKLCCNPAHIFDGTYKDNMQDAVKKGKMCNTQGEKNPRSKLTQGKVNRIRKEIETSNQTALAKKYNVCISTIHNIVKNKSWKK